MSGSYQYRTVDTSTVEGIKEAESLKAAGWRIIASGFTSIQFELKTINHEKRTNHRIQAKKLSM